MSQIRDIYFVLCLAVLIRDFRDCCSYEGMVSGCRLSKSDFAQQPGQIECLCGIGCKREFPYENRAKCEDTLRSGTAFASDPCQSGPCLNLGGCIQLKFGRFRCDCAGTNHHGERCQFECPEAAGSNFFAFKVSDLPLDCIKI